MYKAANKFRKTLKRKIDFKTISTHLQSIGFSVIFYNQNTDNEILIKYGLVEFSRTVKGFTVYRKDFKAVFIDNSTSREEKLYVLLHETAHIVLGHIDKKDIQDSRFMEMEADAFAHEVLNPRKKKRIFAPCLASILIGFILGGSFACTYLNVDTASVSDITYVEEEETETSTESELETEYVLVTPSGTKFHRSDCRYVKGKECTEYIREDALNKYAPCSVCKP